jgi:hypothetical protein
MIPEALFIKNNPVPSFRRENGVFSLPTASWKYLIGVMVLVSRTILAALLLL